MDLRKEGILVSFLQFPVLDVGVCCSEESNRVKSEDILRNIDLFEFRQHVGEELLGEGDSGPVQKEWRLDRYFPTSRDGDVFSVDDVSDGGSVYRLALPVFVPAPDPLLDTEVSRGCPVYDGVDRPSTASISYGIGMPIPPSLYIRFGEDF